MNSMSQQSFWVNRFLLGFRKLQGKTKFLRFSITVLDQNPNYFQQQNTEERNFSSSACYLETTTLRRGSNQRRRRCKHIRTCLWPEQYSLCFVPKTLWLMTITVTISISIAIIAITNTETIPKIRVRRASLQYLNRLGLL